MNETKQGMNIALDREHPGYQCVFLGNSDSLGVPRVYCDCAVCEEARTTRRNRRMRSSVLLMKAHRELLVDCGPDWPLQMELAGMRWISDILITHAHQDHVAGLPAYADVCRWTDKKGHVIAPAEVLEIIRSMYPWLDRYIEWTVLEEVWHWEDWAIYPVKVNHGKNGYSYAYRFERPLLESEAGQCHGAWAYASDAIGLGEKEKAAFRDLDLLVLGTNFYEEPFPYDTRSVYDMVEAAELIRELQPKQAVYTHMSHGVDVREAYPLPEQVVLARTGLHVSV
ncbi:MBL fold metallo-hydrolase [Paenibacillus sp. 1001270B_150601_E10]|uniref:MBL fold metallo-hydrolase n=1 Tax=Paenibacillus sp. 1001270B_150601_E10 TaxID=2787079 RepID=UPI002B4BFF6B|nr:MBL fold metallo-hydrolase [Paenibacillus sp. 1001270B_150601_E10]